MLTSLVERKIMIKRTDLYWNDYDNDFELKEPVWNFTLEEDEEDEAISVFDNEPFDKTTKQL